MESKPLTCSRTFRFNIIAAVLPILADNIHLMRDYLPDFWFLIYMCLVSAGNVFLRTRTCTAVRLRK